MLALHTNLYVYIRRFYFALIHLFELVIALLIMSAMYCEGCDNVFTSRGLTSHLRQTRDLLCQQFAAERDESRLREKSPNPVDSGGDIFGGPDEYADENFGQLEDQVAAHPGVDSTEDSGS